jgi:acetolactate synthase-1/2/3 large subunit
MAQTVGAANLASGLRDARLAGSPVLAITGGRHPLTTYRHFYQEIADFPLYEPLTKLNAELADVRRLPDMLRQAFRAATTGSPGPVHLELQGNIGQVLDGAIPSEYQTFPIGEELFSSVPPFRPTPSDDALVAALDLLRAARRPLILAGGGARTSGAQAELEQLARMLQIPVATSLTGKGLIAEDDVLAIGCVGASSRPSANRAMAEADLVFAIGTQLGSQVTDNWRLPAAGTPVIQLDIEPTELGRNYPNIVSLLGDAKAGLARMTELVAHPPPAHAEWCSTVAQYVAEFRGDTAEALSSAASPIRPERLCSELTHILPADAVLVTDTGHSGIWVGGMIDLRPPQTFLRAAGSLGWAYPAALGAKCAVGERPVVCFAGDGAVYYHLAELETAVRHGINTCLVVNNNSSFSQDMTIFERAFGGRDAQACRDMWAFTQVNLAEVAADLGCFTIRVERPEDIASGLLSALRSDRPAVVDVVTDTSIVAEPPYGGTDFYATPAPDTV